MAIVGFDCVWCVKVYGSLQMPTWVIKVGRLFLMKKIMITYLSYLIIS